MRGGGTPEGGSIYFDTCANQLLLTSRLKYFSAYVHIDVVVKYSLMSNMQEDVKFKFISYVCVTAQKLHMEIRCIKDHYKSVRNELEC
jgi:hypothetical protein